MKKFYGVVKRTVVGRYVLVLVYNNGVAIYLVCFYINRAILSIILMIEKAIRRLFQRV